MNGPLVSVLIPTYNRVHCLGRAIESVLRQTHRNWEIIVVDDGSTDGTADFVWENYADESRLRYVYQPNQGVSAARNHALWRSQGEFLALLDSDDVWLPWKLELQLSSLEKYPAAGMCWTNMFGVDANDRIFSDDYLYEMYYAYRHFTIDELFHEVRPLRELCPDLECGQCDAQAYFGEIYGPMILGNLVHTSTVILRRTCWERVGFFDESMRHAGEDYDFHLRTCREAPVLFLDIPSIRYQTGHADQIVERRENQLHLARGYLASINRALEHDSNRITLPRRLRRKAVASAHAWIGEELFQQGDRAAARKHLVKSLSLRALHHRTWLLFAASLLPGGLLQSTRQFYRRLRERRRSRVDSNFTGDHESARAIR